MSDLEISTPEEITRLERDGDKPHMKKCRTCLLTNPNAIAPTHSGSPLCESGSIASGGKRAHCTCDVCF